MADQAGYRLPRTVVPERYEVELAPDLDTASFTGTASIRVRVAEPVQQIVLNAADLVVTHATLRPATDENAAGGAAAPPAGEDGTVAHDEDAERLHVSFPRPVPAGVWILDLAFTGVLNDKLRGFYRSTWTDDSGAERVIASTQFEPTDARRAFPCWDEPDLKATFAITLVVDETLTAISNGAVVADEPTDARRRRVRFAETMPMSTYLVACVVGPFELTAPADVDGTPLRVATVPGKQRLTDFAVEVGSHALRFLAGYFDIAYPHDKLDHVAIPDFAMGAMENLGCVTYRETALLVDPATSSQLEQRRVAEVVCHETAHMWFGDLVTMRWWNGIWLNEAFATFMETTAAEAFRPEWDIWTAFGTTKAAALAIDGLRATRAIEYPVGRPEEAEAMFDVLTYEKGCAVLRMLEQYLSPEVFRRGIHAYLDEHRHANTDTTDLWDAIESASDEPVRTIMDSWIFQGGYPLVEVESAPDGAGVVLRQHRFLYGGVGENGDRGDGARWKVPVNLRASIDGRVRQSRVLLEEASTAVGFDGKVDWVVVNDGGWGFYRVGYDDVLAGRLLAHLDGTSALERLALVGDAWALVVAGESELAGWAGLVSRLGGEDDPDVWLAMLGPLQLLDLVASPADRQAVRDFVGRLAGPALERLGWDPRPGERGRLGITRSRLIASLGTVGADPTVRVEATRRLREYWADPGTLDPDLATAVVNVVAATGGEDTYQLMLERMRAAATPQEKIRYLFALGQPEDPALLARTLDSCLTAEVRTQDAPLLVGSVMGRREGGAVALGWLEKHWDDAVARFPNNMHVRMLEGLPSLVDDERAGGARRLVDAHRVPNAEARVAQLVEQMDVNLVFGHRVRARLAASLEGDA